MKIRSNLVGKTFGYLKVIEVQPRNKGERTRFKCICKCGNTTIVDGSKIKNGKTKSCGCYRKQVDYSEHNKLPEGTASRNALIYNYKNNAKRKNLSFELPDSKLIELFNSNCYYCGREPYMTTYKKGTNGSFIYTGVDRKENNIGYTLTNSIPCCTKCNYLKNKMNHDEFILWIKEIYENLILHE